MRRTIDFRLDLTFPPRALVFGLAAVMLLAVTDELGSESVTLTTYYPAPSGVYTQMITTGNTYLATQTGNVGVATTAPGYRLTVANGAIGGNYALTPQYSQWAQYGTGDGGTAIYNDSTNYRTLMLVGNSSAGDVRRVSVWDRLIVNGNQGINTNTPTAYLDVQGANAANFGTAVGCCSRQNGVNSGGPTISVSEATSSNSRLPMIEFHAAGYQEAFLRLNRDTRIFEMGDTQGQGVDLALLNGGGSRRVTLSPRGNGSTFLTPVGIGGQAGGSHTGILYINGENTSGCSWNIAVALPVCWFGGCGICSAGQYATYTPGLWVEGYTFDGHGAPTTVAGVNNWFVWGGGGGGYSGVNGGPMGNWYPLLSTLTDDSYYCCPKN